MKPRRAWGAARQGSCIVGCGGPDQCLRGPFDAHVQPRGRGVAARPENEEHFEGRRRTNRGVPGAVVGRWRSRARCRFLAPGWRRMAQTRERSLSRPKQRSRSTSRSSRSPVAASAAAPERRKACGDSRTTENQRPPGGSGGRGPCGQLVAGAGIEPATVSSVSARSPSGCHR